MFKNPFSFEGRIRRSEFGISLIIFAIARTVVTFIAFALASNGNETNGAVIVSLFLSIPLVWFLWAQGAKRCHDLGNSGWWQIIPFYSLWMIFQDGQPGLNEYGENPKSVSNNGGSSNNGNSNFSNQSNSNSSGGDYQGGYSGGHNNPNSANNQVKEPLKNDGYNNGDLYN